MIKFKLDDVHKNWRGGEHMSRMGMRKYSKLFMMIMLCLLICACGKKSEGIEDNLEFLGKWQCAETPLEHPDYYTGYLVWVINQDGSFSMYDAQAGNPGIMGELEIISDHELILCSDMEEEFSPPATWLSMQEEQKFTYKFVTLEELHVTFEGNEGSSTLVFTKMN